MPRFLRICRPLLALWLLLQAFPGWALPGADVAYQINQRYQQTPSECFVASPVQECSGVLMRAAPTPGGDLFALSTEETAAGMARLDYVRRDIETTRLSDSVGFILAPRPEAVGNGKPYELLCGCPPPDASAPAPCNDCPGQPNTVGVSLWNPAAPQTIAVQAIFYDVNNGGQLATALEYQRQYFNSAGQWLPILRVAFGAQGTTAFGYDARDQLDIGYASADDINARYADTRSVCPGNRAAYFCDGVVIRVTGWGTTFHSWNPSPSSLNSNGVSFSYMRADARVDRLVSEVRDDAGMIVREFSAPAEHPLQMRCIYAEDTGTGPPDRCYRTYPQFCNAMNITTVSAFISHYSRYSHCAFDVDPQSFQLSIDVRPYIPPGTPYPWNEAIIALWPPDIPEKLPIEAFFYVGNDPSGVQYVQRDYMAMTGRFMPVVRVNLPPGNGPIFTYDPAVQSVSLGGAAALPPVPSAQSARTGQ
ncbi:hypothetical protein [Pandoraea sp. NPDC087047]|uniref:hypothetical protein n=1 Tax=Pandoraea sp. NPDC087047 TaxID=3364390 RepID=UPI0038275D81